MSLRSHYDRDLGIIIPGIDAYKEVQDIKETVDKDTIDEIAADDNHWSVELSYKHRVTIRQVTLIRNLFGQRNRKYDTDA